MLKELSFRPIYDSAQNSIVNDLLIPSLSNSIEYWRGVGYFASGWLAQTAIGIEKLAENSGKIRFVVSPLIDEKDLSAFQLARQAKQNTFLLDSLRKNIDEIAMNLQCDTLNTFAWLLADNIIEFKFAIPRRGTEGDYHDKVGVCIDANHDMLAFHGSFNDTYKGTLNGEAFSVFQSWVPGQDIYVHEHFKRLQYLWCNGNAQFDVFPFDDAIKRDFINLRIAERPYKYTQNTGHMHANARDDNKPHIPYTLKPYQEKAICSWKNNKYRGIFEMATGTGKTITATAAAVELFHEKGELFLVIVVPFTHLLEQWKINCEKFGINTVDCYGENTKWHYELKNLIMQFKLGCEKFPCVIVVQNTACSDDFLNLISKVPSHKFMMIADETHYLGSRHLQKALFSAAQFRLGLSATPDRWMDDEGSEILYNYYEKTVYSISLDQAISGGFLTRYCYHPILVSLTEAETQEYEILSGEIGRLYAQLKHKKGASDLEEKIERLKLKRARIVSQAENKTKEYVRLLSALREKTPDGRVRDLLVFCAPGTHREILKLTAEHGIKSHEFVHEVDTKSRQQVLNAFADGDIEAIISIKCMDEGVDVPSTKTAIFLASTTNPKEFIQRRGRVLRKCNGKEFAEIYDFIVIPPDNTDKNTACSILRRELPRFAEFAGSAEDKYKAREMIWDVLQAYDVHAYIDVKPWDLYKQDLQMGEK